MAQNNLDNIKDHAELFHQPEYQELFAAKKEFEGGRDPEEVARIAEWTKTWDYREKKLCSRSPDRQPRESLSAPRCDPRCRRL